MVSRLSDTYTHGKFRDMAQVGPRAIPGTELLSFGTCVIRNKRQPWAGVCARLMCRRPIVLAC